MDGAACEVAAPENETLNAHSIGVYLPLANIARGAGADKRDKVCSTIAPVASAGDLVDDGEAIPIVAGPKDAGVRVAREDDYSKRFRTFRTVKGARDGFGIAINGGLYGANVKSDLCDIAFVVAVAGVVLEEVKAFVEVFWSVLKATVHVEVEVAVGRLINEVCMDWIALGIYIVGEDAGGFDYGELSGGDVELVRIADRWVVCHGIGILRWR